jgi:hypothetical protein
MKPFSLSDKLKTPPAASPSTARRGTFASKLNLTNHHENPPKRAKAFPPGVSAGGWHAV